MIINEKDFYTKVNNHRKSIGEKALTWHQYQKVLSKLADNGEIVRYIEEVIEEVKESE